MKKLLFIPLLFICSVAFADPSVTSSSNDTIGGTGFGTQEEGSIYVYDKIETEFNDYWEYTGDLTISGGGRISGNCANMNFINGQNNGYLRGSNSTLSEKWFVSYWFYLENDFTWGTSTYGDGDSHLSNVKVFRLWAPQSSIDESFFLNTWGWGNLIAYKNEGTDSMYYCESGYQTNWEKGTWINFQFQFGESSAITVADGTFKMWRDGQMVAESDDHVTRTTEEYLKRPYNVGFYNSWDAQAGESDNLPNGFRLDDAYVSNTWQRVEVGNNAVYGSCTHREIQIPTAWSDTSISVTWNQGSFEDRETAYLFVIDADGAASAGLEGTFVDGAFYTNGGPQTSPAGNVSFGSGNKTVALGINSGNKTVTIQ